MMDWNGRSYYCLFVRPNKEVVSILLEQSMCSDNDGLCVPCAVVFPHKLWNVCASTTEDPEVYRIVVQRL